MKKTMKSFVLVTLLGFLGKGIGLYRSILLAKQFGSSKETDAFIIALTGVLILSSLLTSSMNNIVVMTISKEDDKNKRIEIVNNILNITLLVSFLLIVSMYFLSPVFISILSSGFEGEQFELTNTMFRVGIPAIMFYSAQGIFRGYLNHEGVFVDFGLLPFAQNIPVIVYLFFFSTKFGITGLMVSQVIGISMQMIIQLPFLRKTGYKYYWFLDKKAKYLKSVAVLLVPILVGVIINDLNSIVDKSVASFLDYGSITVLDYAYRLNAIFLDGLISPIGLILLPLLAASYNKKQYEKFIDTYEKTFELMCLVVIPISFVLVFYSHEIVTIFYGRGAFDMDSINRTSNALKLYSIGLLPMAGKLVYSKIFYSTNDTKTSMIDGLITLIMNLILNIIFVKNYHYKGLALATTITNWVTFFRLSILINKKVKITFPEYMKKIGSHLQIFAVSAIVLIISKFIFNKFIDFYNISLLAKLFNFIFVMLISAFIFFVLVYIVQRDKIKSLFKMIIKNKT